MKLRNLLFIVLAAIVFCNCQSYQPTSLTVASYNLRNANGSDSARGDGWGQRYPVIARWCNITISIFSAHRNASFTN